MAVRASASSASAAARSRALAATSFSVLAFTSAHNAASGPGPNGAPLISFSLLAMIVSTWKRGTRMPAASLALVRAIATSSTAGMPRSRAM